MQTISVFDIFKIGVGPSSSHTLGPWKAALAFRELLPEMVEVVSVKILLYGSLSKTGIGHGTDIAVQLGLEGFDPETIETADIPFHISRIRSEKLLQMAQRAEGPVSVPFDPDEDIVFEQRSRSFHPNGLTFIARLRSGRKVRRTYYSIGGGFIVREGSASKLEARAPIPFPCETAEELLHYARSSGKSIAQIVRANELREYSPEALNAKIDRYLGVFASVVRHPRFHYCYKLGELLRPCRKRGKRRPGPRRHQPHQWCGGCNTCRTFLLPLFLQTSQP